MYHHCRHSYWVDQSFISKVTTHLLVEINSGMAHDRMGQYQQQQNNRSYNGPGKDGYHDQDRLASSDRSRITMLIDNQLRH